MAFLGHPSSSVESFLVMFLMLTAGSAAEVRERKTTLKWCFPEWPPQAWIQASNFFGSVGTIFDLGQSQYEADAHRKVEFEHL